jgi:hypothetical protein
MKILYGIIVLAFLNSITPKTIFEVKFAHSTYRIESYKDEPLRVTSLEKESTTITSIYTTKEFIPNEGYHYWIYFGDNGTVYADDRYSKDLATFFDKPLEYDEEKKCILWQENNTWGQATEAELKVNMKRMRINFISATSNHDLLFLE